MKRNKRLKILLPTLIGLSITSVALVGFSTWIIDGSIIDSGDDVTVKVSEVIDETIIITFDKDASDLSLNFENSIGGERNPIVENQGTTDSQEDLEFKLVYTLQSNTFDLGSASSYYTITAGVSAKARDFYNATANTTNVTNPVGYYVDGTCISADYTFNCPTYVDSKAGTDITITPTSGPTKGVATTINYQNAKYATVTMTYTFGWGEAFGKVNPGNSNLGYEDLKTRLETFVSRMNSREIIQVTLSAKLTETSNTSS